MSGDADYYAPGQWNFYCDLCGKKAKSSDAMRTWDNFYVCKHHKELRNPQDFLRGIRDNQSVPWCRPNNGGTSPPAPYCTLQRSSAIPGFSLPGCMIPGQANNAFMGSIEVYSGWAIQDTNGQPLLDTRNQILYPPGTPFNNLPA